MKKIEWIKIFSRRYGGNIYEEQARKALSEDFEVEVKKIEATHSPIRYLKPLEWIFGLTKLNGKSDLWISDSFIAIAFLPIERIKGKKAAMIYHIDNSVFNPLIRTVLFFIEKLFYKKIKKMDAIVTISDYWEKHFLDRGYKNVYKIYNGFDLEDFNISDEEVVEFKKRFNLEQKPILYIGNCQKAKGVPEIYESLKDLDVHIVTSGEEMVKIPAKNLNLGYKDYLRLLKASTVVIEMHKFKTGWSRISHEAMLSKKPVIASGLGGARELLEKGGQVICKDFSGLRQKVDDLLNNEDERKRLGERGYKFAKNFTRERFDEDWVNMINALLK